MLSPRCCPRWRAVRLATRRASLRPAALLPRSGQLGSCVIGPPLSLVTSSSVRDHIWRPLSASTTRAACASTSRIIAVPLRTCWQGSVFRHAWPTVPVWHSPTGAPYTSGDWPSGVCAFCSDSHAKRGLEAFAVTSSCSVMAFTTRLVYR